MRTLRSRLSRRFWKRIAASRLVPDFDIESSPISAEEIRWIQAKFSRPKFFVFGHPRSGTTLLARLIRVHPDVHCDWQGHFFSNLNDLMQQIITPGLASWMGRRSNHWTYDKDLAYPMLRVLCDYLLEREADQVGKSIVGDKTPSAFGGIAVERLARVYPDAHLIYILRDGRDVVVSRRIQAFIDYPEGLSRQDRRIMARLRKGEGHASNERESIFTQRWLEREARSWSRGVLSSIEKGHELFRDRFLTLRYEDLLEDPVAQMHQIWDFLGAGPESAPDRAIQDEMGRNPAADWHSEKDPLLVKNLRRGGHGGWRDWFTEEDISLFERCAGETLKAWRYLDG